MQQAIVEGRGRRHQFCCPPPGQPWLAQVGFKVHSNGRHLAKMIEELGKLTPRPAPRSMQLHLKDFPKMLQQLQALAAPGQRSSLPRRPGSSSITSSTTPVQAAPHLHIGAKLVHYLLPPLLHQHILTTTLVRRLHRKGLRLDPTGWPQLQGTPTPPPYTPKRLWMSGYRTYVLNATQESSP